VKRTIGLSALLAGAMLFAGNLDAQSRTGGLMLNAHLAGNSLRGTGDLAVTESGGGLGVGVGYGFNDRIALYLNVDASAMEYDEDVATNEEEYGLVTADLGVRVSFGGEWNKLRPYLNAAFTGVAAAEEFAEVEGDVERTVTGSGLTIGGGLQYFFSPALALDVGVQATQGAFTHVSLDGDDAEEFDEGVAFTTSRVQVGLTWHP
jgi:opacity protein-like surface antigen